MDAEEAHAPPSQAPTQTLIPTETERDRAQSEEVQHSALGFDALSSFDADDLIFSDEAFVSDHPDFRCLSSPSASQPPATAISGPTPTPSSSSCSSSSPSSPWPFLRAPDAAPRSLPGCSSEPTMQQPQPCNPDPVPDAETQAYLNLLDSGGVDDFDFSVPWDSAELLPLTLDETGACADQMFNFDLMCPGIEETNNNSAMEGGEKEEGDDLAQFFLEWLKNNKDAISPEDLRSIRLKKSTVESAARRLGADRRGRMQLVKLILSWVQNHHLQRKKARLQEADQPHANAWSNQTPAFNPVVTADSVQNSNPNLNMDFDMGQATSGCNSWFPNTNMYNFSSSCTSNSTGGNSQLFSPVSELHAPDPNMSWDQSYNAAFQGYPMTYQAGIQPTQYNAATVSPMYQQGQSVASMASATREARKKRMARQRRLLSLQHNRTLGQNENPTQCSGFVGQGNNGNRHWGFWSSLTMNPHQQGAGMMDLSLLPGGSSSTSQTKQTMHGSGQHVRNVLRPGVSSSERRQVHACMCITT